MQRKNMWKEYTEIQQKELEELSVRYKECLDIGKTERECVKLGKKMADAWGYKNLEDCISEGTTLKAGDKVYADCMGKAFVMFQLGKKPLEEGMNILGAHIDSPRIDVKQNPLYDISGYALLWWYQEISVGYNSACNPWNDCKKRRNSAGHYYWGKGR